jgi:hypothetical protein
VPENLDWKERAGEREDQSKVATPAAGANITSGSQSNLVKALPPRMNMAFTYIRAAKDPARISNAPNFLAIVLPLWRRTSDYPASLVSLTPSFLTFMPLKRGCCKLLS